MSATVGGAPRHVAGTHAMDRQAGGVPLSLPELQRLPWISSQRRLKGGLAARGGLRDWGRCESWVRRTRAVQLSSGASAQPAQ